MTGRRAGSAGTNGWAVNVINPANMPTRKKPAMRTLIYALIREYGLPHDLQERIENAEEVIDASNALVNDYVRLLHTRHREQGHGPSFPRCVDAVCVEGKRLMSEWKVKKRHQRHGLKLVKKLMQVNVKELG